MIRCFIDEPLKIDLDCITYFHVNILRGCSIYFTLIIVYQSLHLCYHIILNSQVMKSGMLVFGCTPISNIGYNKIQEPTIIFIRDEMKHNFTIVEILHVVCMEI